MKRQANRYNVDWSYTGKEIRRLCKKKNMMLKTLANEAGITKETLRNVIKGTHIPRAETLQSIAQVLGVDVDRLILELPYSSENATIGRNLETIMIMKGISRKQLASMANISISTVNKCIKGTQHTRASIIHKMAKALGVDSDKIIPKS